MIVFKKVKEVRTSDDTVITIKLMVIFELIDIYTMVSINDIISVIFL